MFLVQYKTKIWRKRKMQKTVNKNMATFVAMLLIFSMAISLVVLPNANAQTQSAVKTFAIIGATPNPIGVGQQTLIDLGITQQLANVNLGWTGLTVTVTKPDGTSETLGPFRTDATGGTGYSYTPSMVGNYTLQTHFPQQLMPSTAGGVAANTTMLASVSDPLTLVVTQEPIAYNPGVPLPTEYWTRPINSQFRNWYTISGSSWMSNDYNDGPTTPHILWTKPLTIGGLVGGELGLVGSGATSVGFENGDAYEGKWTSSLILAGNLYYQDAPGSLMGVSGTTGSPTRYHCVDLRTGQELWTRTFLDNRTISFGQLYYWESYNYQGTFAYLWVTVGTTWTAFDAYTGDYRANITNVPSGTRITGPRGEIYLYNVNQAAGYMTLWNLSALVSMGGSFGSSFMGRTFNASATMNSTTTVLSAAAARAYAWNITIPKGLAGSVRAVGLGDRVIGSSVNTTDVVVWGFSLQKGQEGTLLFNNDWKTPNEWVQGNLSFVTYGSSWCTTDLTNRIGLIWMKELRQYYAFSLDTGQYLWVTQPEATLDIYGPGQKIYEGRLYAYGYAGTVYCYSLTNGTRLWTYEPNDVYHEVLWSNNWPEFCYFTSGDKLYFFYMEHSANQPLPRDAAAFCLNATDGTVIWRVDGLYRTTNWGGTPIMGDSVIAMYDTYDQQVYAIGKGPSATTVNSPDVGVTLGTSVMITGTVTDVSPGLTDYGIAARFPNGVPAVSDASQGDWMKYVYDQFPRPSDASGVNVILTVLDSNNNTYDIGTATTDASGTFGFTWQPQIPGQYTIYATFAGSGAYYPSYAETYVAVSQPSKATPMLQRCP
jgi:outer membrane protein assembly factor BamB